MTTMPGIMLCLTGVQTKQNVDEFIHEHVHMSVPTPALFFIVQIIPNRTIAAKNMSTGKLPIVAGGILLSCWATNTFSLPLAQTTMTGSVYLTISLTGG